LREQGVILKHLILDYVGSSAAIQQGMSLSLFSPESVFRDVPLLRCREVVLKLAINLCSYFESEVVSKLFFSRVYNESSVV